MCRNQGVVFSNFQEESQPWNLPKPYHQWSCEKLPTFLGLIDESTRPLFALSLLRCAAVRSDQPLGFQPLRCGSGWSLLNFPDACNLYVSGYMSHKFENEKKKWFPKLSKPFTWNLNHQQIHRFEHQLRFDIHICYLWIPASSSSNSQRFSPRPDTVASVANVLSSHRCSQVRHYCWD